MKNKGKSCITKKFLNEGQIFLRSKSNGRFHKSWPVHLWINLVDPVRPQVCRSYAYWACAVPISYSCSSSKSLPVHLLDSSRIKTRRAPNSARFGTKTASTASSASILSALAPRQLQEHRSWPVHLNLTRSGFCDSWLMKTKKNKLLFQFWRIAK